MQGLAREQFYEQCGREDHVSLMYLIPGTASHAIFGDYIVGPAIYTKHEREELERNLHAVPPVHTPGNVKIRDNVSAMTDEARAELLSIGVPAEHIRRLHQAGLHNPNTFPSETNRTSRDLVIPVRMLPNGQDWDWIYGFTRKRLSEGMGIPPEEMTRYYALHYYYDQEEALNENHEHIFSGGVMREEVEHELLYVKCIRKGASAEELKRLAELHHAQSMKRFKLMHVHLEKAGTSFEKLLEKDKEMLRELCYRVERFGEHHLNVMGKIPIYLNLDRYLHIFLRHVSDFEVSRQFAAKDKFQWKEEEVLRVITRVVQAIDEEAQAFWEKKPGQRFSRFGPKSVYFEGDYYTVQIEADGRLSTLYKNKKDLPRVSDRSGTPQAGNPAEEYSGERDHEALREGTPNTLTN